MMGFIPNSIMNMLGPSTGVNVDGMTMDQKRNLYGSMFDPMEAGRERLRNMTTSGLGGAAGAATGQFNPMALMQGMQSLGLLNAPQPIQPQIMPIPQATPGFNNLQPVDLNQYYKGLMT